MIANKSAPKGKGILCTAFAQQGSLADNLLTTLAFFTLSALPAPDFVPWGWCAPFLLSTVLVVVGMTIRLKLKESEGMKRVLARKHTVKLPLAEVLDKHWKIVLLGASMLPIIHVTYFKNTFTPSWATKILGYNQGTFLSIIVIALVIQFLNQSLGVLFASRIDIRKAACLMVLPEFILMPAMFFAMETKVYWIAAAGMCPATVPHAMSYGAVGGILARAFPAWMRYAGLSLTYQLYSLLVGGSTPVLTQWILSSTSSIVGVALASACYALVSLACTLALLRITGFHASDLSTAEHADAEGLQQPAAVEWESVLRAPARLLDGDPG